MLQYSPDLLQWLLLTASAPVAFVLILLGFSLVVYLLITTGKKREVPREGGAPYLKIGIPGVALILGGILLSSAGGTATLASGIATGLTETAKLQDVKLLHLETVSQTPFSDGSVSYIGTATDVDGDPRQFRYTQYAQFGIYQMVGFDKPAVDLKDESFTATEEGLEIYRGAEATPSPSVSPTP